MIADEFLRAYAEQTGVSPPTAEERRVLLEIAALAAHCSERLAAPLACWMGGVSGRSAADLLAAAQRAVSAATTPGTTPSTPATGRPHQPAIVGEPSTQRLGRPEQAT